MNLANAFTLLRLILCPFFLLFYLYPSTFGLNPATLPFALLALFIVSEISDAMDGWAARRYNHVTELGKILDPMADSIARTSAFLTFTQPPVNLPIFLVFILIYRDSVISTLRTICALKGYALAARMSGKIKAVIQAIVICIAILLLIPHASGSLSSEGLTWAVTMLTTLAAIYTIYTAVEYIYVNRSYVRRLLA